MKSQNLELLLELIGIENFAKLAEHCGGMSFYIPKMPSKKLRILRDIKLLKELEVSKDDIIKRLAKKYELSCRTLRRIYDRAYAILKFQKRILRWNSKIFKIF